MLLSLCVKNYKLIKDAYIEFDSGFNVITGETGSGKTMLMSSLLFLFANRVTKDVIRSSSSACSVTASFDYDALSQKAKEILDLSGIETEDTLTISRTIKDDSRSSILINGTPAPIKTARDILSEIVYFSLQREQNSLLIPGTAMKITDEFASATEMAEKCAVLTRQCREKRDKLEQIKKEAEDINREKEYLQSVYNEIKNAKLKIGEDEEIKDALRAAKHSVFYSNAANEAIRCIDNSDYGILDGIRTSLKELTKADEKEGQGQFNEIVADLENAYTSVSLSLDKLRAWDKKHKLSESDIDALSERDSLISSLKRKHGGSIEAVINRMNEVKEKLELSDDSIIRIKEAEEDYKQCETELVSLKEQLYQKRKAAALSLSKSVEEKLANLEMSSSVFEVVINKKDLFEKDEVKFMFSANKGEKTDEIAHISSGGELSRLYLALLSSLPYMNDKITIVFDEIDSGLGGKTGSKVRDYLVSLKNKAQIIAVTHQGIVAPGADKHIKVIKEEQEGRSVVGAKQLEGEEREKEIARLMAGDESENEALELARSLLNNR